MLTPPTAGAVRTLSRRFIDEVINAHDVGTPLTEMVGENFVEQNPQPGQGPGRAGLAGALSSMFLGFPDLHWTLLDTVVEGDRIVSVSTWTGTHQGPFMGIPPTGRRVTVESWTLDRYRDDQLTESRILVDIAGMLGQLGILPPPAVSRSEAPEQD